nr:MAG TPA: hypothetical protein [Caudoviricetes sp.]
MIIYYADTQDGRLAAHLILQNPEKVLIDDEKREDPEYCLLNDIQDARDIKLLPYTFKPNAAILDRVNENEAVVCIGIGFNVKDEVSLKRFKVLVEKSRRVIWIDYLPNAKKLMDKYKEDIDFYYYEYECLSSIVWYIIMGKNESIPLINGINQYIHKPIPDIKAIYQKMYIATLFSDPQDVVWDNLMNETDSEAEYRYKTIAYAYDYMKQRLQIDIDRGVYYSYIGDLKVRCMSIQDAEYIPSVLYHKSLVTINWIYDGDSYLYKVYADFDDFSCAEFAAKYNGIGTKHYGVFRSDDLLLYPHRSRRN